MKLLQICRTEPDKNTEFLLNAMGEGNEASRFNLYENADYAALVEAIFANDEVITWW